MDYFRAILQRDERSRRAFDLTTEVIQLNPANYTTWHFRRLCIDALAASPNPEEARVDLRQELALLADLALEHPKNYQIWYHRRCIVEKLNDATHELAFTAEAIADDSKNYHAWAHRQWALKRFALWENELTFTDELLREDMRNNSAWNQRYFVLSHTTSMDVAVRQQEISCVTLVFNSPTHSLTHSLAHATQHNTGMLPNGSPRHQTIRARGITCVGSFEACNLQTSRK
jgi:protein farnesyltransferase/geranylgeranyltransferase type-1 subunit alpha